MINLTINGKAIELEKPMTVLEAAQMNGIEIPHLCHHPALEKWGGCRMCLVEVEKLPRLQNSCTLRTADGMHIKTESDAISSARKAIIEFHLLHHPLDCPSCDKAGECLLQDYTMRYGASEGRFREQKRIIPENLDDPIIVRNMARCIKCTRCVRVCASLQGASAISMVKRSNHTRMEPVTGGVFECEYCGNCLTLCPVGAIMSRLHRHSYRQWQIDEKVPVLCPHCGVGCSMNAEVRDGRVVRTTPAMELGVNKGLLCARGRFGYDYISSPERLTSPLLRKNGVLRAVPWDEALGAAAKGLVKAKETYGGQSVAAVAGARCTNEENYLMQKLLRTALGSNNVDSIARLGYAGAQRILDGLLGRGATANRLEDIPASGLILTLGGDPTRINPILGINIRKAYLKGAKVVTVGRAPGLANHRTMGLMTPPHGNAALLRAAASAILTRRAPGGENKKIEDIIVALRLQSPREELSCTGLTEGEFDALVKALGEHTPVSIILGETAAARTETVILVAILSHALHGRVYLMPERPNEQGVLDMGCLPDELPGGVPLEDRDARKRFEDAWGAPLPAERGLTLMEMFEGALEGTVRAMYVMGENPAANLPDATRTAKALGSLDFLVVQDIFMTDTAALADVVLPALGAAEKDGTFTNLERSVQLTRRIGGSESRIGGSENGGNGTGPMDDLKIIAALAQRMGITMSYRNASDVMDEIARVSPLYAGLSHEELKNGGATWPYKGEAPKDTGLDISRLIEDEGVSRTSAPPPPSPPPRNGALKARRDSRIFHTGTTGSHSDALRSIGPAVTAALNPETAQKLKLNNGDRARFTTVRGSVEATVSVEPEAHPSAVYLSGAEKDNTSMSVFGYTLDRRTGAPLPWGHGVKVQRTGQ